MDAETRDVTGATPGPAPVGSATPRPPQTPVTPGTEGTPRPRGWTPSPGRAIDLLLRFQTAFGLVAVIIAGIVFVPNNPHGEEMFLTVGNFADIIRSVSVYGILAVGMTFVIIAGGIDLSVGALLGFSGIVFADMMVYHGMGLFAAILVALLVGATFGLVQGLLATSLKIQPFIVTLAGLQVAFGLGQIISNAASSTGRITPETGVNAPKAFDVLGSKIAGTQVPFSVMVFLVVAVVGAVVLNTTRFGQHVFAVGGNARAARLAGINVKAVIIGTFVICGFLAALGGIVLCGQNDAAGSNQGVGYELTVIASVVIGGTSVMGGVGSVLGTAAGTLLLGTLQNILTLCQVSSYKQPVITGAIIITAVVLQNLAARRSTT